MSAQRTRSPGAARADRAGAYNRRPVRVTAGARLGPYEIIAPLGAGGMGEVYRARDSRLSREVAIKVLPAQVASDPELRRRLDREAQAISSLSHPNICALFDVGHVDGVDFLVMELLDGETLAARLARGALPIDQVLRYGIEIADALAAAHRAGIIHRDLKPGNVMLTRTGARLLDFGLAKPTEALPALDATVSGPITARGTVVGTFHYMSPEQVEGKEVDARSDIFALGALLHEMATGQRAFAGSTTASSDCGDSGTRSAVGLERAAHRARGPRRHRPRLSRQGEERTLADRARRQAAAGSRATAAVVAGDDGNRDVAAAHDVPALDARMAGSGDRRGRCRVGGCQRSRRSAFDVPAVRASLLPPPGHSFTPNDFAVSPDGRRVAFVAAGADGVATLWVSSLQTGQAAEIAGSEGATSPFWSADSRWIAFFVHGQLLKVEPGGAGVQKICEIRVNGRGGAWNANDEILFSQVVLGAVMKVSASGGTPVPVTQVPADMPGEAHRYPQFLPDGQRFVYVASWTNQQRGGLYLGALDGRDAGIGLLRHSRSRRPRRHDIVLRARGHPLRADARLRTPGRLTGTPRVVLRNEVVDDWRFGDVPISASPSGRAALPVAPELQLAAGLVRPHRPRARDRRGAWLHWSGALNGRASRDCDVRQQGQRPEQPVGLRSGSQLATPLDSRAITRAHAVFPDGRVVYSAQREVERDLSSRGGRLRQSRRCCSSLRHTSW